MSPHKLNTISSSTTLLSLPLALAGIGAIQLSTANGVVDPYNFTDPDKIVRTIVTYYNVEGGLCVLQL